MKKTKPFMSSEEYFIDSNEIFIKENSNERAK